MRVRSAEGTIPGLTPKQTAWLEEKRAGDLSRLFRRVAPAEAKAMGTTDHLPGAEHVTARVDPQTRAVKLTCTTCEHVKDLRAGLRHAMKSRAMVAFAREHGACVP